MGKQTKKKILIIENDLKTLEWITTGLQKEKFGVCTATERVSGLRAAYAHQPDLVILNPTIPGETDLDTLRYLREWTDVPIILLMPISSTDEIEQGLALGADDYLIKPFGMIELVAHIQTCLRHAAAIAGISQPTRLCVGNLTIDLMRHRVTVHQHVVELSPVEFQLLEYLARHRGEVIENRVLLREIWGPDYSDQPDCLQLSIRYLRKKIERDPAHPEILKTARGSGYYIEASH